MSSVAAVEVSSDTNTACFTCGSPHAFCRWVHPTPPAREPRGRKRKAPGLLRGSRRPWERDCAADSWLRCRAQQVPEFGGNLRHIPFRPGFDRAQPKTLENRAGLRRTEELQEPNRSGTMRGGYGDRCGEQDGLARYGKSGSRAIAVARVAGGEVRVAEVDRGRQSDERQSPRDSLVPVQNGGIELSGFKPQHQFRLGEDLLRIFIRTEQLR